MVRIQSVGANEAELVFDLVGRLLSELREGEDDTPQFDRNRVLEHWRENRERYFVSVAIDDGDNPVGIITLSECFAIYANGRYGIIDELYIVPEYRSRQVGKMLLNSVKELARTRNWLRIDVTAPAGEKWIRTVRFYEREGFVFTGPKLKFLVI